ncbi:PAS domain S-box protein [Rhodopseudomonas sp.]|uniref:methyl-accepting chemotaxis protein n=1 Tax=Rhodopseudomonas sp. TaxID=1078 RepID=UPI0039E3BFFA
MHSFFRANSSDARYLAAIENSETPLMIADGECKICFANKAVRDLLGTAEQELRVRLPDFSVDTLVGRTIDVFHKQASHQRAMINALTEKHRATIEIGSWTFDLTAFPLFDQKGRRVGVSVEWADASVRLANARFKAVSDALSRSQAMIEFDVEGKTVNANDNFLRLMGYSLGEIVGCHHSMFVEPQFRDSPEYRAFWARLKAGEYVSAEFKRIGNHGKEVWIQASYNPVVNDRGKVFSIVKYATDVTEQKLSRANLIGQIEAIHRTQAVIEFNLDGTIITANECFLKLARYSLEQVRGQHHRMFIRQDERDTAAYREFWHTLARGEMHAGIFQRVNSDGTEFYIEASYNPIYDLNGKLWKIVKFAHDVTEDHNSKLKAERERQELISAVAAGAEELNASVREIAETMVKSRQTANQAASCVDQADDLSVRFSETAQSTVGIVDVIKGIADQINLLALNATIESARAGEAGRGFSVVATEVKTLANQAKLATEKITSEIAAMQTSSQDVVAALTLIKREIDVVQQYVSSTASAVEEQSVVANELSATVQRAVSSK